MFEVLSFFDFKLSIFNRSKFSFWKAIILVIDFWLIEYNHKSYFNKVKSFSKYKPSILKKIDFYKNKLSKYRLSYFYSEFALNLKRVFTSKNYSLVNFQERKVFLYLFQLESLRSIQSGKLILTRDKVSFFSINNNFRKLKLGYLAYYQSVLIIFSL